jgi:lipopolysaccharide export system permease protein
VAIVLILSILHFVLGEFVVPAANIRNAELDAVIHHTTSSLSKNFKVNNIWFKSGTDIYRVGLFIPWLDTIKDITIYRFSSDTNALVNRTDIDTAVWEHGFWDAHGIFSRNFTNDTQTAYDFSKSTILQLPFMLSDFKHTGKTPDEMDYTELRAYIQKLKDEGYSYAPYDVDLNSKISYPLSSLFVILLVIPFSLKKRKTSGVMLAFGVSLAIGFSYWIAMALAMSMGNSEILNAPLAAWLPNIMTLLAAGVLVVVTKW